MNIILDKGQNSSWVTDLNYVAQEEKFYIIDNHLAAIWCMAQLDTSKKYNLLHIDRHYDLVAYNPELHDVIHSIDFKVISVEEITTYKKTIDKREFQVINWDNYINLFNEKFPDTIGETIFITQKEGDLNYSKPYKELEIYELFAHNFETDNKWIFNIDLDYFFTVPVDTRVQMYTDEYIEEIGFWLRREYNNAEIIILCLSPECCGDWNEALRVLDILLTAFNKEMLPDES